MPKSASSDLFELILSMSKAEKAAFKIYVRGGDTTQSPMYLKLFDLVEKRKVYNEKKIIQLLKIDPVRFPELKHYLYNLVLKGLNDFHRGQTVNSRLAEYVNIINLLFEKGLFEQCRKQLRKAIALAIKFEKHSFLIELYEFELSLYNATQYSGITKRQINNIDNQVNNSLKILKVSNDYNIATELAFLRTFRQGGVRNKSEAKFIVKLYNESIVNSKVALPLPFDTILTRYSFLFRHYVDLRDFNKAHDLMQKVLKLIESNPHQIPEHPRSYAVAISNTILCLLRLKRYSGFSSQLKKLSEAPAPNQRVRSFIFFKVLSFEMEFCKETGDFVKGITFVEQLENMLSKKRTLNAQTELLLYYYSVIICLGAKNYNRANYFLRKILDGNFSGLRVDVYCFAKILSLIVNFELNNHEYLEYSVKSVYRYLYKRRRLYKLESIILEFIQNEIPRINNLTDQLEAFKKLREKLLKLKRDSFEKEAFDYFDFISWLDSKIENRSFAEVVREKAEAVNGC
ncbi:MAG: hypothetical protein HYU69_15945 [Bacteroidetes bacterium]|nr:hypothetical protein [Bacteroidota bacterium]